jgi:hypothetical protein
MMKIPRVEATPPWLTVKLMGPSRSAVVLAGSYHSLGACYKVIELRTGFEGTGTLLPVHDTIALFGGFWGFAGTKSSASAVGAACGLISK